MSTSIDQSFVRQYEAEVHHVFQRQGGILRPAVRTKDNVVGKSTTFQRIGTGTATTKARHGVITPMNVDHTPIECPISDFYAGDYVDRLDEAKTNIDERMALAKSGAWALGRKVDDQIFTEMDATTQTAVTLTLTNVMTVENSLLALVGALDANDVPNDGERYAALTSKGWQAAMKVESFASADYVGPDGLPFKEGAPIRRWKSWQNVMWTVHNGLPGKGTATAKGFAWHKSAIGYATGAHPMNVAQNPGGAVMADITWHGDRAAHFINHWMSGGAKLIEDAGVIEFSIDDTAALPTAITS
jgi:capsid protein